MPINTQTIQDGKYEPRIFVDGAALHPTNGSSAPTTNTPRLIKEFRILNWRLIDWTSVDSSSSEARNSNPYRISLANRERVSSGRAQRGRAACCCCVRGQRQERLLSEIGNEALDNRGHAIDNLGQ